MAELEVWMDGREIVLRGGCNARACSGEFRRRFGLGEILDLFVRDVSPAKKQLWLQGFRMMAKKIGLDMRPEPSEYDVPLICDSCLDELNEYRSDHRGDEDV